MIINASKSLVLIDAKRLSILRQTINKKQACECRDQFQDRNSIVGIFNLKCTRYTKTYLVALGSG